MPATHDPVEVDLVLSAERVSQLLLGGRPPGEELDSVLEDWIEQGVIDRGALFLRTIGSWELLTSARIGFAGCRIGHPVAPPNGSAPSKQRG